MRGMGQPVRQLSVLFFFFSIGSHSGQINDWETSNFRTISFWWFICNLFILFSCLQLLWFFKALIIIWGKKGSYDKRLQLRVSLNVYILETKTWCKDSNILHIIYHGSTFVSCQGWWTATMTLASYWLLYIGNHCGMLWKI